MAWLLDSNACIMHLRGRHPQLTTRWQRHPAGEIFIPLPVYAELLVGAEKSSQRERVSREIELLLEAHDVVEVTEDIAAPYARIRADLERRGTIIGTNDIWIAALALAHEATLVTNNTNEF